MAQKTVHILDIGEVILSKRRGAKNLRLSITSSGKVRISLPTWVPYRAGIVFARQRASWIQEQLKYHRPTKFEYGMRIGKLHRLYFERDNGKTNITTKIEDRSIWIKGPLPSASQKMQTRAEVACEKALALEATELLLPRLELLAKKHGFKYKKAEIKKLRSRWGSYSNTGVLSISVYLIQLPWEFIDYVLLHELVHTQHMHHGQKFWARLNNVLPAAKTFRKQIRLYKPRIHGSIE